MKTMKTLYMAPLFLLLTSCHYSDHIVIAARDIPVGTVLQRSDLRLDHGWRLEDDGACMDLPSNVVGHKTLRPLVKGDTIRVIDIDGPQGSAVLNHTPDPCLDSVADGWGDHRP